MSVETRPFDPATYLDSEEAIAAYMTEALESNDIAFIGDALDVIARARGARRGTLAIRALATIVRHARANTVAPISGLSCKH